RPPARRRLGRPWPLCYPGTRIETPTDPRPTHQPPAPGSAEPAHRTDRHGRARRRGDHLMQHHSAPGRCPGFAPLAAFSRRHFLRVGSLGALGLSLPTLLAAEAHASDYAGARSDARARSCILLFLAGGPSQYETFDPKPEARSEYRTIFGTIPTAVPGTFL